MSKKLLKIDKHLFTKVMKEGRGLHSEFISLKFLKSAAGSQGSRISLVVSKKSYKKAVDRNKLKRRGRAIFQKIVEDIPQRSYILFLKKGALEISFKNLEKMIKDLFIKMK